MKSKSALKALGIIFCILLSSIANSSAQEEPPLDVTVPALVDGTENFEIEVTVNDPLIREYANVVDLDWDVVMVDDPGFTEEFKNRMVDNVAFSGNRYYHCQETFTIEARPGDIWVEEPTPADVEVRFLRWLTPEEQKRASTMSSAEYLGTVKTATTVSPLCFDVAMPGGWGVESKACGRGLYLTGERKTWSSKNPYYPWYSISIKSESVDKVFNRSLQNYRDWFVEDGKTYLARNGDPIRLPEKYSQSAKAKDGYYRYEHSYAKPSKYAEGWLHVKFLGELFYEHFAVTFHLEKRVQGPEPAELESSIQAVLGDFHEMMGSFRVYPTVTAAPTQPKTETSLPLYREDELADLGAEPLCDGKPEQTHTIHGRITDGHGHPLPFADVWIKVGDQEKSVIADGAGYYQWKDVEGIDLSASPPQEAIVQVDLNYKKDETFYFGIVDDTLDEYVALWKEFTLTSEADLEQDVDFNFNDVPMGDYTKQGADGTWNSRSRLIRLDDYAAVYYYTADTLDFIHNVLDADIDYKLPVEIFVDAPGNGAYYNRVHSYIKISTPQTDYANTNRPKNREYHEFNHHLTFSQWNGEGLRGDNDRNHFGFVNEGTGDSYTEGFAEFMAMVEAEYARNDPELKKPANQYAAIADLEDDYKPWQWRGRAEELAVAGILWDLYDKANEGNDSVTLGIKDMWDILKPKRANFYEYYKAFVKEFPDKKEGIDAIFVSHGFFADNQTGNKKYDEFESFWDADKDQVRDEDENYVDYGVQNSPDEISWNPGEEVGRATNYERPNRGLAVEIPGAFIKAPDTRVRYYMVRVDYADGRTRTYTTENRGGRIYLAPVPEDVSATYTVTPQSQDYRSSSPYTITSHDYVQKYYAAPQGQGYFDEHDFALEATGSNLDPRPEHDVEPAWEADGGYDNTEPLPEIRDSGGPASGSTGGLLGFRDSDGGPGWIMWLGGGLLALLLLGGGCVLLVVVFILWRRRRKKQKEKTSEQSSAANVGSTPQPAGAAEKKYCTSCGTQIAGEAQFCMECGGKQ